MSKNPLAVVGLVTEINPIAGADRIQQAVVVCGSAGKWSGVVGKEVAKGERVTVFLQDAVLPPDSRWSFMEKHHWRVRMARFKGCPSECLIIGDGPDYELGTDLTSILGVTKHEKPVPASMAGEMVGPFPSFIPKTDEPNFQTIENFAELMARDSWYATEKADGTSCTAWNDDDGLHVCSRNWELREFSKSGASNVYWKMARKHGLDRLPRGYALQFEVVGPGIQGNPLGLTEVEARAFSLYDIEHTEYAHRDALFNITLQLEIPMVPVIGEGNWAHTEDSLRKLAEIRYENGEHAEGIVVRATNSAWSFKVLNLLYTK